MNRPAHIPPKIWTMARQSGQRNGGHDATVQTAEMLMRRLRGGARNEDAVIWWPALTRRQTRIIGDALMGHDTVIDADVSELFLLRSWFCGETPESGAQLTDER